MTSIDPLSDLESMLADLPAAIDNRRLGDSLTRAIATLKTSERQVERIEALLGLTKDIGFGETKAQSDMVEELRDAAYVTGDQLERADTASSLEKAVFSYDHDLAKSLNNLDRNIGQHWRTLATREFEPLIAIGNLLTKIDSGSDLGAKLTACGASARATPEGLGGRPLFDHVTKLMKDRERLQARRHDELGNGDVAQFVNALAEDRATLMMVTPQVSKWLGENHAMDKLKVRPAV